MNEKYAEIIDLPRHISPTREPMSAHDRAAQFAPYSALSGYEETVEETARLTERRIELDEGEIEVINRRLTALMHKEEPPMAKITYLGTCSGTEPIADMHHCSLVIEVNGVNYWFDAGENCSYSAHLSGINLLNTKALFISHPHVDHVGGLANLLFTISKLITMHGGSLINQNTLSVFSPKENLIDACLVISGEPKFNLQQNGLADGVIFQDENVKVTAFHNAHLDEDGSLGWHSFSFLIEADGKKIVFSGDVKCPQELSKVIGDGCDYLIHETGHHKVTEVIEFALAHNVKCLCFNHHGRQIINDRVSCQNIIDEYANKYGICIKIASDLMVEEI